MNSGTYDELHRTLLHQSTQRETKLATTMQDPVRNPPVLQPRVWDKKVIYAHYFYDGSQSKMFREKFFGWWKEHYAYPG